MVVSNFSATYPRAATSSVVLIGKPPDCEVVALEDLTSASEQLPYFRPEVFSAGDYTTKLREEAFTGA